MTGTERLPALDDGTWAASGAPLAALPERARRAAEEILAAGQADNTVTSYRSALRYWCAWSLARSGTPLQLPVPTATVIQFIVDHTARTGPDGSLVQELPSEVDQALVAGRLKGALGPLKLTTIKHRIAVLSVVHQRQKLPNPCEQVEVRHLLASAHRAAAKRGERKRKKTAATLEILEAMLATCDDSLTGHRDRAILMLGWACGGRRRSEIAGIQVSQLHRVANRTYWLRLGATKTDPMGELDDAIRSKPVVGRAAAALEQWLAASKLTQGPLFRRIWGASRLGPGLSSHAIAEMIKRRAKLAGVDGDWGGHSLRSGFITEAGRSQVPLAEVMAMSDHRQVATVVGYHQAGALLTSRAASLLKE
jgi:integrase